MIQLIDENGDYAEEIRDDLEITSLIYDRNRIEKIIENLYPIMNDLRKHSKLKAHYVGEAIDLLGVQSDKISNKLYKLLDELGL